VSGIDGLKELFHGLGISAYPLAICSVLLVTVLMERFYFLFIVARPVHLKLDPVLIHRSNTIIYSLVNELISVKNLSKDKRDEVMGISFSIAKRQLHMGLGLLQFIGTIAPMFGILGNVLGMVNAFTAIQQGGGTINPVMVSEGLKEAMYTTAVGIGIAIPALFCEFYFGFVSDSRLENYLNYINRINIKLDQQAAAKKQSASSNAAAKPMQRSSQSASISSRRFAE
jgi:biopolymer transport protein ExbB